MTAANERRSSLVWVIPGDLLTFLVVTIIGFGSHETLRWEAIPRILATFLPFSLSWFIMAPWLGVFQELTLRDRSHLPRVLLAAALAAPVGAFLRGLWLGAPILPVFVLVMAAVSGLGMTLWRAVLQFVILRLTSAR